MAELKSPVVEGMQDQECIFANGVAEHYPIPALAKSGCVLMRLEFDEEERRQIEHGDDVFVEILTNGGIQPLRFTVGNKDSGDDWRAEGYGTSEVPETLSIGNRHGGLEAAARLASGSHENWEDMVRRYNETCVKPPLPDDEIENIIEGVKEWKKSNS